MADSVRTDDARTHHEPTATRRPDEDGDVTTVGHARGGFSLLAVLTGVVVALGAMSLLTALIGGIGLATGLSRDVDATTIQIGWGIAIAVAVAQFLSYLWGGYTAGRMARGSGVLNGLLVPIGALLLVGAVVGIVAAAGNEAGMNVAFLGTAQLPVASDTAVEFSVGVAVASLIAMFLGALLGGVLGTRWHDRLEHDAEDRSVRA